MNAKFYGERILRLDDDKNVYAHQNTLQVGGRDLQVVRIQIFFLRVLNTTAY